MLSAPRRAFNYTESVFFSLIVYFRLSVSLARRCRSRKSLKRISRVDENIKKTRNWDTLDGAKHTFFIYFRIKNGRGWQARSKQKRDTGTIVLKLRQGVNESINITDVIKREQSERDSDNLCSVLGCM